MSELSKIMVRSGLLKPEQLDEFRRWGYPQEEVALADPSDVQDFVQQIETALQDEDMVLVRETDLEALHIYLRTAKEGAIRLANEEGVFGDGLPIHYALLRTGEYVLPWVGEDITPLLSTVDSYLTTAEGVRVHFGNVRELFYGEVKAFAVCTPIVLDTPEAVPTTRLLPEESDNGSHTPDDCA